jgi:hypothetical protein
MCGTGSDSKADAWLVLVNKEQQLYRSLTCEKLQRMWPLMRIGEKEVV